MKVFDVSVADFQYGPGFTIPVFAEDAAQASRIAIRTINKSRDGKFKPDFATGRPTNEKLDDVLLEHVTKVEQIRDKVAS